MFRLRLSLFVLFLAFNQSLVLSVKAEDPTQNIPDADAALVQGEACSRSLLEKTAAALGLSPKIDAPVLVGTGGVELLNPGQVEAFATYTRLEKIYNSYLLPLAIFLEFSDRRYFLSKDIVVRKISLLNDVTSDFQKEQIARRIALRLLLLFRDDFSVDDYKAFDKAAYSLNLSIEQFKEVFKNWKNEAIEDPDLLKLTQMIKYLITYESKLFIERIKVLSTSQILAHNFRVKSQAEVIDKSISPIASNQSLSVLSVKFRHLLWALKKSRSQRLVNFVIPRVRSKLSDRQKVKLGFPKVMVLAKANSEASTVFDFDSKSGPVGPLETLEMILVTLRNSKDSPIILYREFKKILDPEKFKINPIEFKVFFEKLFEDRLYHSLTAQDFTGRMNSEFQRVEPDTKRSHWSAENTKLQILLVELALRCLNDNLEIEFVEALKDIVSRKVVNNLSSYTYNEAYVVDVSDYLELILESKKKGAIKLSLKDADPTTSEATRGDMSSSENQEATLNTEAPKRELRSVFGPG